MWIDHIFCQPWSWAYSKETKKFIENKNITNINRIQIYDSIMCGYFCIGFIDFMLKGKRFLDYTNLLSPNDYEKNDQIILKLYIYTYIYIYIYINGTPKV